MIGGIEEAILQRLRDASEAGVFGAAVRTIASYGGQLSDRDGMALVAQQSPALLVTYGGERTTRQLAGGSWEVEAQYYIYALARTTRSEAASRLAAGPDEIGSYQLIEDARALLSGWVPLPGTGPLQPQRIDLIEAVRDWTALSTEYRVLYEAGVVPVGVESLDDLRHVHLDWDVPPLGTVRPPLPSADAEITDAIRFEI